MAHRKRVLSQENVKKLLGELDGEKCNEEFNGWNKSGRLSNNKLSDEQTDILGIIQKI